MADYSKLTNEAFDRILLSVLNDQSVETLLAVPGVYEPLREEYNNDVLTRWERDNPVLANPPIIYDCWPDGGGEPGFADRYTVIPRHGEFQGNGDEGPTMFLGCSQGGRAFSQWGELKEPYDHENYAHLGRRLTLDDLDEETRQHIIRRLSEEH